MGLDLRALEAFLPKSPKSKESPDAMLLQDKGTEHETAYLERLRGQGLSVVEIPTAKSLHERFEATQGALVAVPWPRRSRGSRVKPFPTCRIVLSRRQR